MPAAGRLLQDAIASITLTDALSILSGGDDAATRFLRGRTEPELETLLAPPMRDALTQSGAFTALDRAAAGAGLASTAQDLRGQMVTFAVDRALDGAFTLIAEEERAIRRDPLRRTSALLRRVFGGG
jgi:hypothetical protein